MPHRDPTQATLAHITQLRVRIAELDMRAVGSVPEPTSLEEAIAERERLERHLLELERRAIAVAADRATETDGVASMVFQDWPAPEEELT